MTTKAKRKAKEPTTSYDLAWDRSVRAFGLAMNMLWAARRSLTRAEKARRDGERELATLALAMHRAGDDRGDAWLTCWWNNFETSPRGNGPCVHKASEIPADAKPLEETANG